MTVITYIIWSIVGCLKITKRQVIKKQSPNSRHRANHSHHCSTKTRGSKPASQHHYSTKTRGSKPASQHHCSTKTRWSKPASQHHCSTKARNPRLSYNCPGYWVNCRSHNEEVNPHCGVFLGGTFTSETFINSPACYWGGREFWERRI